MGGFGFVKSFGRRLGANGPGLTVAVIALILALAGGAFAASGALTGKQKKEVTKIAKQYAGKNGANGVNGKDGASGTNGAPGKNGENGKSGESVTISAATNGECPQGGTKFSNATGAGKVCNGKPGEPGEPGEPGPKGEKGEPWTPNNTLPTGAIETGTWAFSADESESPALVPISFPIQLPKILEEAEVHFSTEPNFGDFDEGGAGTEGCLATFKNPSGLGSKNLAIKPNPSGQLCIYLNENGTEGIENATFEGIFPVASENLKGASKPGGTLVFKVQGGRGHAIGSWAVTGP